MRFEVDPALAEPLHEQIVRQVRAAFDVGAIVPGERLPPARELAEALDVNMHTVLRGYQGLRDLGLVELRRGAGARIRPDARSIHRRLQQLADELRGEALRAGLTRDELVRLVVGAAPAPQPAPSQPTPLQVQRTGPAQPTYAPARPSS